jgi:hypothetical protein
LTTGPKSLKQPQSFSFEKNSVIEQHVDVDKLETLICIETLLVICYQSISWLVHNQTIRKECQQFEQHAQYHQEELHKIFPLSQESKVAIENKVAQYLSQLEPARLPLREVINLAINLAALKMNIYKYFSHRLEEHHELLKNSLADNAEEMYFLRQERNFHQTRLDTFLKV